MSQQQTPSSTSSFYNYGASNTMSYIDQMMMFQSMSMLKGIFEKNDFTLQNIILVILLISFDAIRKTLIKMAESFDIVAIYSSIGSTIGNAIGFKRKILDGDGDISFSHDKYKKMKFEPYIELLFEPTQAFW